MKWLSGYCFGDCKEMFVTSACYFLGSSWTDIKFKWVSQSNYINGYIDITARAVCSHLGVVK
jgi:hypothetical protein